MREINVLWEGKLSVFRKVYKGLGGIIWILYLISKIADASLTAFSSNSFGIEVEINPIIKFFMAKYGPTLGNVIFSIIEVSLMTALSYNREKLRIFDEISSKRILIALTKAHTVGALSNIYVFVDFFFMTPLYIDLIVLGLFFLTMIYVIIDFIINN